MPLQKKAAFFPTAFQTACFFSSLQKKHVFALAKEGDSRKKAKQTGKAFLKAKQTGKAFLLVVAIAKEAQA